MFSSTRDSVGTQEFLTRPARAGWTTSLWNASIGALLEAPEERGCRLLGSALTYIDADLLSYLKSLPDNVEDYDGLMLTLSEKVRPIVSSIAEARDVLGRRVGIGDFEAIDREVIACCRQGKDNPDTVIQAIEGLKSAMELLPSIRKYDRELFKGAATLYRAHLTAACFCLAALDMLQNGLAESFGPLYKRGGDELLSVSELAWESLSSGAWQK